MKPKSISPYNFIHSYYRVWIKYSILFLGFIFLLYGLYRDIFLSNQVNRTLWIIDNSLSMVVQDIRSSSDILLTRLDIAQSLVLSGRALIPGEHALMTLGDGAKLLFPFSDDGDIFTSTLQGISPVLYDSQTDIEGTLSAVELIYGNSPMHVIVLTDGEDTSSSVALDQVTISSSKSYSFIAVGTPAGGPMLQGYDAQGNPRYKNYEGKVAISRLDMDNVDRIGAKYKGHSYLLDNIGDIDNSLLQNLLGEYSRAPYLSHGQGVALIGVICILIGLMFPSVIYKP